MTSRQVDHLITSCQPPRRDCCKGRLIVDWEHGHAISIDPSHIGDHPSFADLSCPHRAGRDGSRPAARAGDWDEPCGGKFSSPCSKVATDDRPALARSSAAGSAPGQASAPRRIDPGNARVLSECTVCSAFRRAVFERAVQPRSDDGCRTRSRTRRLRLLDRQQPRLRCCQYVG